ncbi:ankyrin repeat-containing domain [Plakobranchus ocellatus]|uniref:Ankyrin repeat-containing domain n=1 Tax=Plakobranchus ocellatus TaxID=259542 RepID=A0AAV3YAE0_9GAST|nr:ankyrin repeat-containing domain [Plakobranchus ocellatus]
MSILDCVNWRQISFQELDSLLRLHGDVDKSLVDEELKNTLTPLCIACKYNREDLVTVLLHHGADIEKCCSSYRKRPLHFACDHSNGNLGLVRKILEAKAITDSQDADGNTGLHLACTESNVPVVELLLENQADVSLADLDGETPLVRACFARSHRLVEVLLHAGSDPNVKGGQPLEIVVGTRSVETLKLLIESGADVQRGAYLAQASEMDLIDMMKILNNYGADVNKTNNLGMTPLQAACFCRFSSAESVRLLLSWGANVQAFSSTRETALHYACAARSLDKMRLLLAYGAHPGALGAHWVTPITAALVSLFQEERESQEAGSLVVQMVRLLLAAGAKLRPDRLQGLCSIVVLIRSLGPQARQELLDILEWRASRPASLQELCRICVRRATAPNVDSNVVRLPLPKQIVAYLQFEDIL